ncbi:MAG: helix-hairpin-helix domain-containing protein [Actinomycetota bacterium]|nr:helix-hairpin-helix domain-containing protein [Actinomycetota bacterium]
MSEIPLRPAPHHSLLSRARSWVEWVGVGRLVASAVVVLAVVAGAYWLVKPPPATTESKLPYAGSSGSAASTGAGSTTVTATSVPVAEQGSTSTVVTTLVVHVAGAVAAPGVYEVPAGARVIDAVLLAGGMSTDADADSINLAAPVADGQRVFVPRVGEVVPAVVNPGTGGSSGGAGTTDPLTPAAPVNLNTATADELDTLPGVGPATAAAILAYRDQHGPFASVEALGEVRGIGQAKLDALRGLVTV